ncbi:MAG: hypothetical protein ACXWV9_10640 [Flavisolibacter sp.]
MNRITACLYIFICCFFLSCKGEVTVVVDRAIDDSLNGPIHLVIDDNHDFKNIADTSFALKLKPGTHRMKINNGKAQEFKVGDDGGILNISNQEYVAFEIPFRISNSDKDAFDVEELKVRFPAIVDSFFVSIKSRPDEVVADTTIIGLLPYLNSEKKSFFTEEENVSGLRTVGKNTLFINKFWDFDITDTIPRQISEFNSNRSTSRSSIRRARLFLLLAQLDSDQYFVRSISDIKRKLSAAKVSIR